MKITAKNGRDVTVKKHKKESPNGPVYELTIDDIVHIATIGLDGADPVESLKQQADMVAEQAETRKANREKLKDAGF